MEAPHQRPDGARPGATRTRRPLAGLALLGLLTACARPVAEGPPDLLVVTLDTVRADHLGCYGYDGATSPNLDRLAAEGARFEVAYAPMGTTDPSHATLFTGLPPVEHGLVQNGQVLTPEVETLAELLAARGYRTAAFVSSHPLTRRYGLDQGFEIYDDQFPPRAAASRRRRWLGEELGQSFDRRAEATVDAAVAWLARAPEDRPLFVWVHFFDPHHPYDPPAAWYPGNPDASSEDADAPGREELYDAEIRYTDAELGRLLDEWAARRRHPRVTLVATDHGEAFGEHEHSGHNRTMYEEELRAGLVLHAPGRVPAGAVVSTAVHLGDVLPTLGSLLGTDLPSRGDGRDLLRWLDGSGLPEPERPVFFLRPYSDTPRTWPDGTEERGWGLGMRRGTLKYLEAPDDGRRELYDLAADPGERTNLAERHPELVAELSAELSAWFTERVHLERVQGSVAASGREGLEALGYVGGDQD